MKESNSLTHNGLAVRAVICYVVFVLLGILVGNYNQAQDQDTTNVTDTIQQPQPDTVMYMNALVVDVYTNVVSYYVIVVVRERTKPDSEEGVKYINERYYTTDGSLIQPEQVILYYNDERTEIRFLVLPTYETQKQE